MEVSTRNIAWYRTPVERETMKALNKRSDWKGLLQVGGHLTLIGLTATTAWHVKDQIYLLLPVLFLHGTFFVFLLNATHELVHNSVFKTRFLNEFFLRLFCFMGWRGYISYWASHAEHHKYTLHPPDDLEVVLPLPLSLKSFLKSAVVDPWTFYATLKRTLQLSLGKLEGEWENYVCPPAAVEKRRTLYRWARFLLLGHTTLIVLSFYCDLWLLPLLTTFATFYGGWLRYLCNNTQHAGLKDDVTDFRLCTRTVILSPFVRFLYWHMNYHIEHHMYAAVPCYNLGKLHQQISYDLPACPRGLVAAWKEIISTLRRQKSDPAYQRVPELPPPLAE